MKRWMPPIAPARAPRWQSRAEILKAHLDSLSPAELLVVRPDYYAIRFLARHDHAKAYDPNQPRVPAGNPDGGRWTSEGGTGQPGPGARRIRLAGPLPTDDPPELPKQRPSTSAERTRAIKEAARLLGRYGGPLAKIVRAAYWLYEYDAKIEASLDPPMGLDELQRAVTTPKPGYHRHHIVEQTSAEQDGYPRSLIDGQDNLVRIPALKHEDISAWYSTKNKDFGGLSPRDYLRGKSWDRRRAIGLDALRDHGVLRP